MNESKHKWFMFAGGPYDGSDRLLDMTDMTEREAIAFVVADLGPEWETGNITVARLIRNDHEVDVAAILQANLVANHDAMAKRKAAEQEAWERAEYERLRVKFGGGE